jgi:hypothetical protein
MENEQTTQTTLANETTSGASLTAPRAAVMWEDQDQTWEEANEEWDDLTDHIKLTNL